MSIRRDCTASWGRCRTQRYTFEVPLLSMVLLFHCYDLIEADSWLV